MKRWRGAPGSCNLRSIRRRLPPEICPPRAAYAVDTTHSGRVQRIDNEIGENLPCPVSLAAGFGCQGAQERSVPAKNGCSPNAPEGGHSTQAGTPLDVAPVALPEPPEPARAEEADPVLPVTIERAPTGPAELAPELKPPPGLAVVATGAD